MNDVTQNRKKEVDRQNAQPASPFEAKSPSQPIDAQRKQRNRVPHHYLLEEKLPPSHRRRFWKQPIYVTEIKGCRDDQHENCAAAKDQHQLYQYRFYGA